MVFVPFAANSVGVFDASTNTFTNVHSFSGADASSGIRKFLDGVLAANGEVILVPYDLHKVGVLTLG